MEAVLTRVLAMLTPLWGGGYFVAFAQLAIFYYSSGCLFHFALPAILPVKGIQQQKRRPGEVRRDAIDSLGSLAVKAAMLTCAEKLHANGVGKLYDGPVNNIEQVVYLLAGIVAMDLCDDGWFYWTHRLLHWRPLYRMVHSQHHRSVACSAFTGYSFHPVEAALVFFSQVLVCFLFPLHIGLHRGYHIFMTSVHQAGHAGYEIAPFAPMLEGLWDIVTYGLRGSGEMCTVQAHDLHHRYPTTNFSLYFTHWDRLMSTLHPQYDAKLFRYFDSKADRKPTNTVRGPCLIQ